MKRKIQKTLAASLLCLSLGVTVFGGCPGDIPMPCRAQSQTTGEKPDFIDVIIKLMKDWF